MGWNGSDKEESPSPTVRNQHSRQTGVARIVIFILVALSVVIAALWLFSSRAISPSVQTSKQVSNRHITAVSPSIVSTNVSVDSSAKLTKREMRYWEQPTTNGLTEAEIRKWFVVRRPRPHYTNDTARTAAPPRWAIFSHHSENEIAMYLSVEPGTSMIGTPNYGKKFKADFLKSCEEPIVIREDDNEYDKALKTQMKETKIALMERMRAGEDLGEILLETRQELQRLGAFKRQMESDVRSMVNAGQIKTVEDLDLYVQAANKMLESKGVAPLKVGPVMQRAILLNAQRRANKGISNP